MTITNNQHSDDDECPRSGKYVAKRASGEVLATVYAANEFDAYDTAEGQGLPVHYVAAIAD